MPLACLLCSPCSSRTLRAASQLLVLPKLQHPVIILNTEKKSSQHASCSPDHAQSGIPEGLHTPAQTGNPGAPILWHRRLCSCTGAGAAELHLLVGVSCETDPGHWPCGSLMETREPGYSTGCRQSAAATSHHPQAPSSCWSLPLPGIRLSPWAQLLGLSPHSTCSFSAIHHLVLCLMSSCNFLLSSEEMFSREATSSTSSVCRLDVMEQWLC